MVDRDIRARLSDPAAGAKRRAAVEPVWDLVWLRRLTYFATLAAKGFDLRPGSGGAAVGVKAGSGPLCLQLPIAKWQRNFIPALPFCH